MIIFDLDGTLADCEHRRHFVDPEKNPNYINEVHSVEQIIAFECDEPQPKPRFVHRETDEKFKPDWKSFYEACDKDSLISPVAKVYEQLRFQRGVMQGDFQIWSGRCESVKHKTYDWLHSNLLFFNTLKMRPIGDSTPDDILKERWLDEALAAGKTIECVFDDRPKVVRMWRRRGIFVFNCAQHDGEF